MASNEHKNLQDPNIHNPKGYEGASNETILTKGAGSGGYQNGPLQWIPKGLIKTTTTQVIGYSTGNGATYEFRNSLQDGQSPYEIAADFGSATIGGEEPRTIASNTLFRTANYIAQDDCTLVKIRGWYTTNTNALARLAICKASPVNMSVDPLAPVELDIISFAGDGASAGNTRLKQINETSFTESSISVGDMVFPMVMGAEGQIIYFNVTLEFSYEN